MTVFSEPLFLNAAAQKERHNVMLMQRTDAGRDAQRLRTVIWVVALATAGLIFEGYDLVVYGTVVSASVTQDLINHKNLAGV